MHTDHSSSSSPPLRVALFLDTRVWAGTEAHVLSLARALQSLRGQNGDIEVRVTLATPRDSVLWDRARAGGLVRLPVGRRGQWDPTVVLVLARRLRRKELDILHVHNGRTALWGTLAVKLAGRGACVATQHFIAPAHAVATGAKGRLQNVVHRFVEGAVARHISISRAVASALLERSDVSPERVGVVFNGIAVPAQFANTSDLPPSLRADVACVARLEVEKDLPTLIAAMKILNARRENSQPIRCVIAGEGEEEAALALQIEREGVGEFVLLAGWTPRAASILRAAKVAVLPSVAEPFGLAILEAMAQAKPVVAVNAGGPPEIVRDGETGLLVPPRDAEALADALETLLDDPQRAQTMGEAGFERLRDCFSAGRMARETLAVYRSVSCD